MASKQQEIIKTIPSIEFNKKILTAIKVGLSDNTRVLTFEGTVRSAKTVTACIIFRHRVKHSTAKFHLIASRTLDTLRRNIVEAEFGLMSLFPNDYEFKRDEIGGFYLSVKGTDKQILLAGYSDASRWKNVLGGSIENIFIDEINIADELFVQECYSRQAVAPKPFTIYTLNGDDPVHKIYTERVNKSIIIGDCPASTRVEMETKRDQTKWEELPIQEQQKWLKHHTAEQWQGRATNLKKRGYFYMFWSFEDNPAMTVDKRKETKALYPVGSYYYKTRILGERGSWGTMIFADYMTPELLGDAYVYNPMTNRTTLRPEISDFSIGGDTSGNKAFNVFVLTGFNKDHSKAWVCDIVIFPSKDNRGMKVGYEYKTKKLMEFFYSHKEINGRVKFCAIDSAEQSYINDLNGKGLPFQIVPSYKATILERIDMMVLLFSRLRLIIDKTLALEVFKAYQSAKWTKGKEGKEREDLGEMKNDIMDGVEYSLTPYMTVLTRG